jgi:hypothetical protein
VPQRQTGTGDQDEWACSDTGQVLGEARSGHAKPTLPEPIPTKTTSRIAFCPDWCT